MFKIKSELQIREINKFYKREADVTTLGDKTPQKVVDYIFVVAAEIKTGTYFYYNFNDFNYLFCSSNRLLTCDKKYIDENFTEVFWDDLISSLD